MLEKDATQVPALGMFAEWVSEMGGHGWLASVLDVSRPTVYRWASGEHAPEAFYRRAIHDLSKGRVHFDDWYTDEQLRLAYQFSRTRKRRLLRRERLAHPHSGGTER